jgi:hypothetical protein
LPAEWPALSLYADGDDAEWKRIDDETREVLRLDGLLITRDEDLRRQIRHSNELQAMVAHHDEVIAERTRSEAGAARTHADERERLTREIAAQERIVAYRESARWWLLLPLVRARRLWNRIRAL